NPTAMNPMSTKPMRVRSATCHRPTRLPAPSLPPHPHLARLPDRPHDRQTDQRSPATSFARPSIPIGLVPPRPLDGHVMAEEDGPAEATTRNPCATGPAQRRGGRSYGTDPPQARSVRVAASPPPALVAPSPPPPHWPDTPREFPAGGHLLDTASALALR